MLKDMCLFCGEPRQNCQGHDTYIDESIVLTLPEIYDALSRQLPKDDVLDFMRRLRDGIHSRSRTEWPDQISAQ